MIEMVINRRNMMTIAGSGTLILFGPALASGADTSQPSADQPFMAKTHAIKVTEDVKFGRGEIDWSKNPTSPLARDLLVDVYEPIKSDGPARPALILAHGGAYHRGTRKMDEVDEGGSKNTSVSEYCREFARRGYVCFSIDYRLMQEDPAPSVTPTLPVDVNFAVDRVNFVRQLLKLPPTDVQGMIREIEAATDDFSLAVYFARARSAFFNIDVNRIAIGGFSAGANTALNAGFAEKLPVAAIVSLSGSFVKPVPDIYINGTENEPALLMFIGEKDLPDLLADLPSAEARLRSVGAPYELVRIPGATHFYPRSTAVAALDGSATTVEERMATFLYDRLNLAALSQSK